MAGSMSIQQPSAWRAPTSLHEGTPGARPSALTIHELVTAHFELVWRWLRAFGVPRDDADDTAQQVFMIASRKLEAIVAGSERAFLFGTARGVAANYRRISRRRPHIADEAEVVALLDDAPNPEETLGDRQAHAVLEHLISLLDDDLRDVFVLFQLEEMSTAEIAAILEIPSGTVASRLRRAREEFHKGVTRLRTASTRTDGGFRR
jgi:RNA polymerase sigma-70 factor (ECF subfamily)